ncbi:hypothetical protein CAEBREN_07815 [Caenorhabditis brenneri]|uniref:Uncharacterized protein n=1 Tax=Caenorhabditis brenneri TaxID=135651 RepID=G0PK59_CAEBE|nr:hypothetical protein CAEBREN_07815 [Caenorhabditis brenneri]
MKVGSHLLILSRHVLCSDCAINHHNGHQTINIENIKYSKKDIKMTTSQTILELFRRGMDNISYTTECRLRHGRIEITGRFLLVLLRELDYKEEGECGYLGELIKMELITKYIEDIDQKWKELTLFANEKKRCECNRVYNKLTGTRTELDYKYHFDVMCHSGIERFTPGCPLFFKSHLEKRLKFYEIIGETPPEQVTPEPFNHRQCPLCLILDHSEHKQKPTDHYRKNWLEIVENIWKNELPPFSVFCCRCLDHLNHFHVGSSCGKWEDYRNGDKMPDMRIEDKEERFRIYREQMERRHRDRHLRNTCQKPDCLMKDPKFWKYEIIREVVGDLGRIMDDGCHHQNFSCQLKMTRLESTASENLDSGPCSKCSIQTPVLRICLTCDMDNLCTTTESGTRLKMQSDRDLLILSRHVICSDCAINHHNGHQTINIEKIKLTGKRTLVNYKKDYDEMCYSEIERFTPGCPLFFKSHLKHQLKFYEMIVEVPPKKVTPEPFNDQQCPLCVTIDYNEHKQNPIDYYRQNWLEIVENIWKNELPPLSDFCCRCLDHLNLNFVGSSCGKWEDSGEADKKMGIWRFLEKRMDRRYRKKHLRTTCEKPDCLMKDPKFWKYEIIREVAPILRVIIIERYRHRNVSCQLKDIRMGSTFLEVIRTLLIIDLRKHSREEFNLILKNMDNALERLKKHKNIIEQEIQVPTCRCSELWTMNERVLEKKRTRNDATQGTRELCLEFKKSMEEMAKFSLKEEIPGCPMDFDHGIVLNPIVLEKLEDIDLEDSFEIIDVNLEDSFEIIDVKFY